MKSKRQLYDESVAGFANIKVVMQEGKTTYLIPVSKEIRQTDCLIEDIKQENLHYSIEAVKEENYTEVPTTVQHELTFEQHSIETQNAIFKFTWEEAFKGFICLTYHT